MLFSTSTTEELLQKVIFRMSITLETVALDKFTRSAEALHYEYKKFIMSASSLLGPHLR